MVFRTLFLLSITLIPLSALAAEPLFFHNQTKDVREQQVVKDFKAQKLIDAEHPFDIAPVDLNGDGVDEWIIRQKPSPDCAQKSACRFTVAGLRSKKPAVLGAFEAGKVGISSEKEYGVRKLLVYNRKNDDFAFSVYVWNPHRGGFEAE